MQSTPVLLLHHHELDSGIGDRSIALLVEDEDIESRGTFQRDRPQINGLAHEDLDVFAVPRLEAGRQDLDLKTTKLVFEVMDFDQWSADDAMGQSEFPLIVFDRDEQAMIKRAAAWRKKKKAERERSEAGGSPGGLLTRATSLVAPKLSPAFLPGFGGKSPGQPAKSKEDLEREAFMRGEGGASSKKSGEKPDSSDSDDDDTPAGGSNPNDPTRRGSGFRRSKSLFDSLTGARKAEAIVSVAGFGAAFNKDRKRRGGYML